MKFKLIKKYPGLSYGLKIGDTVNKGKDGLWHAANFYDGSWHDEYFANYPEFWEPVEEKEYEILSFITESCIIKHVSKTEGDSIWIKPFKGADPLSVLLKNGYKIYSVKRLSDGEVFTIGDKITDKIHTSEISRIAICNHIGSIAEGRVLLTFKEPREAVSVTIDCVTKCKQHLFTTEDGVDIYDKNVTIFKLWTDKNPGLKDFHWSIGCFVTNLNTYYQPQQKINKEQHGLLYFSTKEAAEEYILMNKPCLSINDVWYILKNQRLQLNGRYNIERKLKELVKQKI